MLLKTLFTPSFFVVFALSVLLSGCAAIPIPLSEDRINAELYSSTDDLVARASQLKVGMTKEACFKILNISEKTTNVERLNASDIRNILYGSELRVTSYEDTERFKMDLAKHSGYKIPFSINKKGGALSLPMHVLFLYRGYDMTTVLLFAEGKLIDARITGVSRIDRQEKRFIFSVIDIPKM